MTGRLLIFSHFFTALFGALLAVFWLGVGEDSGRTRLRSDPDQEAQIVELRSRWLSEQELREELEGQLALLRANALSEVRLSGSSSAAVAERESLPVEDSERDSASPSQVSFPPLRAGPPDLEKALTEVRFEDAFEAVISRVRSGDIEGAMAQLEKIEATLRLNGPLSGLLPLYETVFDYWVPQWLASSQGSGENWVRLLVEIRERRWPDSEQDFEQGIEQGIEQGPLLSVLGLDEFLALTVYSGGSLSAEVTQHVVEHLRRCLKRQRGLDSAEIVALAALQSDEVVPLLGEVWRGGKGSKQALMALIQVRNTAAKSLLESVLPEIKDLKLRSALEIWLSH